MLKQAATGDPYGFPKTRWDLVIAAPESEAARNQLFGLYNRPVLAYFRALTKSPAAAEELRQSFFLAELIRLDGEGARGVVRRADQQKGRFRDFLKVSLRRHWLSSLRTGREIVSPLPDDTDNWESRLADAEQEFLRAWVRQTLVTALRTVEGICRGKGQEQHFALFVARHLPRSGPEPSWDALAVQFGLASGHLARGRAETARAHLRRVMNDLLVQEHPGAQLADEVLDILSILGDDDA